ncbi:MAG: hypothetical protein H0V89_06080 [Deltaproteobacteria bacterium]|nr:hypothetical protein [Deltaproteobacteria bacterium]
MDLAELAQSVIDEIEPAHRRRIRLQVIGNTKGQWDSDRLAQLLTNLAANACEHGLPDRE